MQLTDNFIDQELGRLDQAGLRRKMRCVDGAQGPVITVDGRQVLNFCSNNYLGLCDDDRIKQAAIRAIDANGFGSGASRLVCGNLSSHQRLEKELAQLKGAEQCLLFNSGYMANVGIIHSLFGRNDMIYSDRLNHASIIDGIQLSQAQYKRYPHCDMDALEAMLKSSDKNQKKCIITDSVFSMDGDLAPLDKIVQLAKQYNCLVMIDEAHALGVMGERGMGLAEHFGVEQDIDVQMGTFSKAAGTFGAYCCGSEPLIDYLINKSRSFIYTTGLPPSTADATLEALSVIQHDLSRRNRLWENTKLMQHELKGMGFDIMNTQTPIIPILVKDNKKAQEFSGRLFEQGIFVSAIRPPTVPRNMARLRLTIMATHTKEHIQNALHQLNSIGKEICLI